MHTLIVRKAFKIGEPAFGELVQLHVGDKLESKELWCWEAALAAGWLEECGPTWIEILAGEA